MINVAASKNTFTHIRMDLFTLVVAALSADPVIANLVESEDEVHYVNFFVVSSVTSVPRDAAEKAVLLLDITK